MKVKTEAKNIIEKNLDIVATVAYKYENEIYSYNDVASLGCIGLIKAANTIDQRGDVGICTYITQMIEEEICKFFESIKP